MLPNAGMSYSGIIDGANYSFTTYGKAASSRSLISSVTVLQGGPDDSIAVQLKINRGRPLQAGRYELSLKSLGITDIAGNPLDGDFSGKLPSGNHQTGGDYHALLDSNRGFTFAPLPTVSTVKRNSRPAKSRMFVRPLTTAPPRLSRLPIRLAIGVRKPYTG